MNIFNKKTLSALYLSIGLSTLYGMELHNKDYYKQHFMRTIEHRDEDPADFAKRQLNHVEENSPQWQALQEIIQEHTPQATTTTTTTTPERPLKRASSTELAHIVLKRFKASHDQQPIPAKNYPQEIPLIWVRTSDNQTIALKKWQIDEMKLLQLLLAHQKGTNSQENPIILPNNLTITADDFLLIAAALDETASEQFEAFYDVLYGEYQETLTHNQMGEGRLRRLLNIAQKLEANGISALFAKNFFQNLWGPENPLITGIFNEINRFFVENSYRLLLDPSKPQQGPSGPPLNVFHPVLKENETQDHTYVQLSPNSSKVALIYKTQSNNTIHTTLIIVDAKSKQMLTYFPVPGINDDLIAVSPDLNKALFMVQDKLTIFNTLTNKSYPLGMLEPEAEIDIVVFSPDSSKFATICDQGEVITIWDVTLGKLYTMQDMHSIVAAFNHRGSTIAFLQEINNDQFIVIQDVASKKIMHTIPVADFNELLFSPNDTQLVTFGAGLAMWDLQSGEKIHDFIGNSMTINGVKFSPDGRKIISTNYDNLILWDVQSGKKIHNLIGHQGHIQNAYFDSAGEKIISVSSHNESPQIILWDVESGEQLYNIAPNIKRHYFNFFDCALFNNYLIVKYDAQKLIEFYLDLLNINDLNIEQIQALYQWYLAVKAGHNPLVTQGTRLYAVYQSLPDYVKKLVLKTFRLNIEHKKQLTTKESQLLNE